MNTLKIDLSDPRFTVFHQMLNDIESALQHFNIDFYVLGALARDLFFTLDRIPTRTTADVDLAVYINGSEKQYEDLKKYLIEQSGFTEIRDNALSLISRNGHTIDLLPFGNIAVEEGVIISGRALANIKASGFNEVFQQGLIKLETVKGESFYAASLSSIVLLKLIAYDDRPEYRPNDPGDVASIIKNFFALNADNIYEHHTDLFNENDDLSLENLSAKVIGREIKQIINQNIKLETRITTILEEHIKKAGRSSFILNMVSEYCSSTEEATKWLNHLLQGLNEYHK